MKNICSLLILIINFLITPVIGHAEFLNIQSNVTSPRNVIMLVGDGMGIGQIEIARQMEYGKDGRLFLESLPNTALVHTYSDNNVVTDSAAGGTAIAIGKKTNNGMIGVTPDGKEADSILDLFKKDGRKTGVISTNTVTDATPAAFTASVMNRWTGQAEIARQQLENKVDVLLGGGALYFSPKKQNGKDLIKEAIKDGYTFVKNRNQLLNANGGDKLLGLFHSSYMSFKLDRKLLKSQEPALQEMTQKAIEFLSRDNKGFFLMAEGARIDHASHSADLTSIWKETIEFDYAVKYAVEWARKDGNTLVIVLADHETMGISATEPLKIQDLKKIKATPEFIVKQLVHKEGSTAFKEDSIRAALKKYANMDVTDEELENFNDAMVRTEGKVYPKFFPAWEIGSLIAERNLAGIEKNTIRSLSTTGGHTGNLIPLFAYGKGSEIFRGVLDNTDVPNKIAELMGYEF